MSVMAATNGTRNARYRELHPLLARICVCGKEFQPKTGWQKFCDKQCAQKKRVADGKCADARRRYRERHPERARAANRESMRRNRATPEGKRYKKGFDLKGKYGITLEIFEQMAQQQNGCCATCLCKLDMGFNTHVDHDHKTNVVRGLLCSPCNRSLGGFRDDPTVLRRAADYIERKRQS